ncbi:hypothetical protein MOR12E_19335 [Methylobacterium oryzae]
MAGLFHSLDGRRIADDPEDVALFGSAAARSDGDAPDKGTAIEPSMACRCSVVAAMSAAARRFIP